MQIENATPADIPAIRALLANEHLPTDDLHEALLANFWVARDGARVCGTVAIENLGTSTLLRSLAVTPAYRHDGLGRQLVAHAEAKALDNCADGIYLLTTTASDFFSRLGYRVVPRDAAPTGIASSTQFRGLCPASATFMAKKTT